MPATLEFSSVSSGQRKGSDPIFRYHAKQTSQSCDTVGPDWKAIARQQ